MDDLEARSRNRPETEAALRAAACDLLAKSGFQALGVNAIARAAGCDKQLIYRYFGGLDGLMAAVGEDLAAWVGSALDDPTPHSSYAGLVEALLMRLTAALRYDPLARQIAAWEIAAPSPLMQPLAKARSKAMQDWVAARRGSLRPPPGTDAPALIALLVAAIQHLALAEAGSGALSGLTLDDAGWHRIESLIRRIIRQELPPPPQ